MPKTTDGTIALVAIIAFAAWLLIGLPLLYIPSASHENAQSLWVPTDSVGLYTLVLAAFTALLVVVSGVQGYFLLHANKTARIAAEAAKKSADIIPAIERPYLFVKGMTAFVPEGQYAYPSQNTPRYPSVEAAFFNYGRTPANIAEAAIFVRILDHMPTDADAVHVLVGEGSKSTIEVIIGPDREWSFPTARCIEPISEFGVGKALYCWGYIKYRDIFGNIHPTNFCRQYAGKDGLVPVGGFERNNSS